MSDQRPSNEQLLEDLQRIKAKFVDMRATRNVESVDYQINQLPNLAHGSTVGPSPASPAHDAESETSAA